MLDEITEINHTDLGGDSMDQKNAKKRKALIASGVVAVLLVAASVENVFAREKPAGFYIADVDRTYQHELHLSGCFPNATEPCSFYVYTDDPKLSFEQLSEQLFSSQYETAFKTDFYLADEPVR